jgi:molybdopterin/thiamine biosynthesis adenylyltransferase
MPVSSDNSIFDALAKRTVGVLPSVLRDAHVLVVGAGSVGSQMVDGLVRSGVGRVTVIDHDIVETANLSRSVYTTRHLGKGKADSLAEHARSINLEVETIVIASILQAADKDVLRTAVERCDLIIAATDDPDAQIKLNRISQHYKKPALFVGLYKGAKGGEVVLSVPEVTSCFECFTGSKRVADAEGLRVDRATNYGTGRLTAEVGLGADITFVTSAATKIALSLLSALSDETASARMLAHTLIRNKLPVVTFGMEPDYWFFPEVFKETPGQLAFQSVWIDVACRADCPGCASRGTDDPIRAMTGPVDVQLLRSMSASDGRLFVVP